MKAERMDLSLIKNAKTIRPIQKGFSTDEKVVVDETYLIKLFPEENLPNRIEEFETARRVSVLSKKVPKVINYGRCKEAGKGYLVLTYLPGVDGEEALKRLPAADQHRIGMVAGRELKKLHALEPPADVLPWEVVKKKKSDRYLKKLEALDVEFTIKDTLRNYIHRNVGLLKGRPNRFQHDDFHPSNILIHDRSFSGIIDFQRMDWGDPLHDLHKLGFFSKQVSVPFTRGVVDGYLQEEDNHERFWELYALYSAMHLVSAIVWCKEHTPSQVRMFLDRTYEVLDDHDHFTRTIPKWYEM